MKIIHCADIHLGSKIDSKFPKEISEERKREVRNSFSRMVDYAKKNGVSVILLSGDVFDRDIPYKKDKDFFFSVVKENPDVDFLYLRGNHDSAGEVDDLPNLKTFQEEWTYYPYGEVVIGGIELVSKNATSLYSTLALDESKKNILLLHGQIGSATGVDKIQLNKLRDKNIDYLALGHVHEYSSGKLDNRGEYAYSGCLEGRGFDETGEKGFILLEIGERVSHTFIPFSKRPIIKAQVDVTNLQDAYKIALKAKEEIVFSKDSIYRIELVGEIDAQVDDMAADVKKELSSSCAFVDVKDETEKKLDFSAYENDLSLKGEFVRLVQNSDLDEKRKMQILAYGLRALNGREVNP